MIRVLGLEGDVSSVSGWVVRVTVRKAREMGIYS